ncbi:MAG: hypothetical protein R3E84_03430 [Pseudomonadales bacterium]
MRDAVRGVGIPVCLLVGLLAGCGERAGDGQAAPDDGSRVVHRTTIPASGPIRMEDERGEARYIGGAESRITHGSEQGTDLERAVYRLNALVRGTRYTVDGLFAEETLEGQVDDIAYDYASRSLGVTVRWLGDSTGSTAVVDLNQLAGVARREPRDGEDTVMLEMACEEEVECVTRVSNARDLDSALQEMQMGEGETMPWLEFGVRLDRYRDVRDLITAIVMAQ